MYIFLILCLRPYITCTRYLTLFLIKFNCCVYYRYYLPIRLRRVVKCGLAEIRYDKIDTIRYLLMQPWAVKMIQYNATSTTVIAASGLAKYDPQSIWSPQKNCGSFVDAIFGILTNKANISIYYYSVPYRISTDSKTRDLEWPFCVKFCFAPVRLELWSLAFEAWLLLNL